MAGNDSDLSQCSDSSCDLDLSCGSESDLGLLPYQFEPEACGGEKATETQSCNIGLGRLSSELSDWCQCGNCSVMETARECLCCTEIPQMASVMQKEQVQCITLHPAFTSLCLDRYVFQTCYYWFNQQYGQLIDEENSRFRYVAYRMLVRYIWVWLGRDIRVILPACAVLRIRKEYPSKDGHYTGYQH